VDYARSDKQPIRIEVTAMADPVRVFYCRNAAGTEDHFEWGDTKVSVTELENLRRGTSLLADSTARPRINQDPEKYADPVDRLRVHLRALVLLSIASAVASIFSIATLIINLI